jgi:hypothetical protein
MTTDPTTRDRRLRIIRILKVCVLIMPLVLIYGLWETRGGPLLPRIAGAAMNLCFTALFIVVIRMQKDGK